VARPRQRVRLEDGLRLDPNHLIRQGLRPEPNSHPFLIQWNRKYPLIGSQNTLLLCRQNVISASLDAIKRPHHTVVVPPSSRDVPAECVGFPSRHSTHNALLASDQSLLIGRLLFRVVAFTRSA
jgi:hypothetical protein